MQYKEHWIPPDLTIERAEVMTTFSKEVIRECKEKTRCLDHPECYFVLESYHPIMPCAECYSTDCVCWPTHIEVLKELLLTPNIILALSL